MTTTGQLDPNSGIFITDDGKRWQSIGCIDFGNNNFYEVMVPEKPEAPVYSVFAGNTIYQFPIYLMCHDDGIDSLGQTLPEFLAQILQGMEHHLPEIIIQLGSLLEKYSKTVPPAVIK